MFILHYFEFVHELFHLYRPVARGSHPSPSPLTGLCWRKSSSIALPSCALRWTSLTICECSFTGLTL